MELYTYEGLKEDASKFLSSYSAIDLYMYRYFLLLFNSGLRTREAYESERCSDYDELNVLWDTLKGNNDRIILKSDLDEETLGIISRTPKYFEHIKPATVSYQFTPYWPKAQILHEDKSLRASVFRHLRFKYYHYELEWSDSDIAEYFGEKEIASAQNYIYSNLYFIER